MEIDWRRPNESSDLTSWKTAFVKRDGHCFALPRVLDPGLLHHPHEFHFLPPEWTFGSLDSSHLVYLRFPPALVRYVSSAQDLALRADFVFCPWFEVLEEVLALEATRRMEEVVEVEDSKLKQQKAIRSSSVSADSKMKRTSLASE